MLVAVAVGKQNFRNAVELGGGFGDGPAAFAGDQHMHVAAERLGSGQRLVGRILERLVVVLGEQERGHDSTPTSFLSLSTSSPTVFTFTPALRPGGSVVLITSNRGATSTP